MEIPPGLMTYAFNINIIKFRYCISRVSLFPHHETEREWTEGRSREAEAGRYAKYTGKWATELASLCIAF